MPAKPVLLDTALSIERIRAVLSTRTVGRRLCLYDSVRSTNAALRPLAAAGAGEGTVLLAETQTAGRGRGGQPWFSPAGVNLYASVLLRPAIPLTAAPVFTFMAPLALADAIRALGLTPAIKWPNDVLVKRKKVGGVLVELASRGDALRHIILGVGVNLNVTRASLRAALGEAGRAATSLAEALGRPIERNAFAAAFLNALDGWLAVYGTQGAAPLLRAWQSLDIVTGRRVEVREGAATFDGRACGLGSDGTLQVEDSLGRRHAVVSGEIRLLE